MMRIMRNRDVAVGLSWLLVYLGVVGGAVWGVGRRLGWW